MAAYDAWGKEDEAFADLPDSIKRLKVDKKTTAWTEVCVGRGTRLIITA